MYWQGPDSSLGHISELKDLSISLCLSAYVGPNGLHPTYIANYLLYLTQTFVCRGGGILVNLEPYFDISLSLSLSPLPKPDANMLLLAAQTAYTGIPLQNVCK